MLYFDRNVCNFDPNEEKLRDIFLYIDIHLNII